MSVAFRVAAALILATAAPLSAQVINNPGDPALAGATTVDFTGAPQGEYGSFSYGGIQFTPSNPSTLFIESTYAGQYNTSGTYLANRWDGFNSLRMDFLGGPVSAFGFNFGASDAIWTLTAYDASDNALGSVVIPYLGESNAGDYFGLTTGSANIAYATLNPDDTGDYVMIDNIAYTGTTVTPEPASLVLMGTGLVGIFGVSRRRRRATA